MIALSEPLWRSEKKIAGWPSVEPVAPDYSAPSGQPVTTHILTARRKHRDARSAAPVAEQGHVVGRHRAEGRSERAPRISLDQACAGLTTPVTNAPWRGPVDIL